MATCSGDGVPNCTYVSQMMYVDPRHVALSFQFFNKTRDNILANPQATALVIDPLSAAAYRLELLYLRTETEGALFQSMKAKLAGIASHTGMSGVFKLRGADVYRVLAVQQVPGAVLERPAPARNLLNALRQASAQVTECSDLGRLLDTTMALLGSEFDIAHALLLMADERQQRLYTVASRGYLATGVGSEIRWGEGVIGVAAQYRTPIRMNHFSADYGYGLAVRAGAISEEMTLQEEIAFPGLPEPHSQLAVPLLAAGRLLGVLFVESPQDLRFAYDDEDALVALCALLALAIDGLQGEADIPIDVKPAAAALPAAAEPIEVRRYRHNDSLFLGGEYLIKGVPGAILWKLLRVFNDTGRSHFTNRELRLCAAELKLPEITDNLEARLILLQRRLAERCPQLGLHKTGRGQFSLRVGAPLRLVEAD
jgi:hypothetical protein